MRVISKSELAGFLTLETLAEIHRLNNKINLLEKKYSCTFKQFEKRINKSKEEIFEECDDYIDWKAYTKILESLQSKVKDLKRGNFKVA